MNTLENKIFNRSQTWPMIHQAYLGRFQHKISYKFCCSPSKQENNINMNMNNMNNNYGEMGSFCKSLKIEKTIAYAFNNVSLN